MGITGRSGELGNKKEKGTKFMKQQGGKVSAEVLFVTAIVILIVAVFVYIKREDNSYEKIAQGVSSHNAMSERAAKDVLELRNVFDALLKWQETQQQLNDKILQRLQLLDMRLDAQPKHVAFPKQQPFPQPLQVQVVTPVEFIPRKVVAAQKKTPNKAGR